MFLTLLIFRSKYNNKISAFLFMNILYTKKNCTNFEWFFLTLLNTKMYIKKKIWIIEFINRNLYGRSHYFVRITTCNLKYDNFLTECFSHFCSPLKKGRKNIIKKFIIHKMSCLNTKNHWRLNFFIHTISLNTISSKSNNNLTTGMTTTLATYWQNGNNET